MGVPETIVISNEDYSISITVKNKEGQTILPEEGIKFPQEATELLGIDNITVVSAKVNPGYIIVCSGGVCRKYWI